MTRTRYRFHEAEDPYFITCTTVAWLPIFAHPQCVKSFWNRGVICKSKKT